MFFASDNWAGPHPAVANALNEAATGFDSAYGSGEYEANVIARFREIFERDVAVFFVMTGTAANSLALASVQRPGGFVFSSGEAHILTDEAGAPEYLSGGGRVRGINSIAGKVDPGALSAVLDSFHGASVHHGQAAAISITQATELGTVYTLPEIDEIAALARKHGIALHMDGARFANALVTLNCSPAEMTWKRGVDVLSFGGTKNGCWCAEAVIFFDPAKAASFNFMRMRAGHLLSKSRFIAAQFDAYLKDDLWLKTARHANAMAAQLANILAASPDIRLGWRPEANEVFPIMPTETFDRLLKEGAKFYSWDPPKAFDGALAADETMARFVTSFATDPGDIANLAKLLV